MLGHTRKVLKIQTGILKCHMHDEIHVASTE